MGSVSRKTQPACFTSQYFLSPLRKKIEVTTQDGIISQEIKFYSLKERFKNEIYSAIRTIHSLCLKVYRCPKNYE